jgi:hypothetical protein
MCDVHYKRVLRNGSVNCTRTPPSTASTKEEIRDYNHLLRLAFPERSRASVQKWRSKNKDKIRQYERNLRIQNPNFNREKRLKNPEGIRKTARAWIQKNKLRLSEKRKCLRLSDMNYKLRCVLRCRMNRALQDGWKTGSSIQLLGCSIDSFKIYLESLFESGMSWGNHGRGIGYWNIDHIIPCALFDLSNPEHQRRCFHFSNLQPMWATKNSSKGAKTNVVL